MQNKNNNSQLQACTTAHYWTIVSGFDNYMYNSLLNKETLTFFIADKGCFNSTSFPPAVAIPAWNSLHYQTMYFVLKKSTCHQHKACVCLFQFATIYSRFIWLASALRLVWATWDSRDGNSNVTTASVIKRLLRVFFFWYFCSFFLWAALNHLLFTYPQLQGILGCGLGKYSHLCLSITSHSGPSLL